LRAQNKSSTTRGTTKSNKYTLKDEKLQSYTDKNGVCYHIGGILLNKKSIGDLFYDYLDHIYLEINKHNEPYSIACILDFRLVSQIIINYRYIIFVFSFLLLDTKRSCYARSMLVLST
jgi:hypothetical protein